MTLRLVQKRNTARKAALGKTSRIWLKGSGAPVRWFSTRIRIEEYRQSVTEHNPETHTHTLERRALCHSPADSPRRLRLRPSWETASGCHRRVGAGPLNKEPRLGNRQNLGERNKEGETSSPGALGVNCAALWRCTEDLQAVTWYHPERRPGGRQDSAGGIPNRRVGGAGSPGKPREACECQLV